MLLREMFSTVDLPNEDRSEIDWIGDLKFFIDNDSEILKNYFFPAISLHQKNKDNPGSFRYYITPIEKSKTLYCQKFQIPQEKITKEQILELAKIFYEEQQKIIERGDYET